MVRRILFFLCCLWLFFGKLNAEEGRILLWINEDEISENEFVYYYDKYKALCNSPLSVEAYLEHFIDFKLKAADARAQGWDTFPDFRRSFEMLCRKTLKSSFRQTCPTKPYKDMRESENSANHPMRQWVRMRSISIPLLSTSTHSEEAEALACMRVVRDSLKTGASFDSLTLCYGNEAEKKQVGAELSWIPLNSLLQEFSENLSLLDAGQVSEPFISPLGVHIVQLVERKNGLTDVENYSSYPHHAERKESASLTDYEGRVSEESEVYSAGKIREKEMEEGLLVARWDMKESVRLSEPVPSEYLKDYFDKHKKEYVWEFPHFKGGVIHCHNRKSASKIKKKLRKLPMEEWRELLKTLAQKNKTYRCEIEIGLFRIGENPYVDKLAFKCGELPPDKEYSYSFVLGKRLNKAPEEYTDVIEQVTHDFRLENSRNRLKSLREKFGVKIDESVLKTVNCSGSN